MSVDQPTVTVIIPVFNRAAELREALRSVQSQSSPPDEVLVVDDASAVPVLIDDEFQHLNVRVLRHQANRGAAAARNTGIKNARGDWLAFLDSDDAWAEDKLHNQRRMAVGCRDADNTLLFCNAIVDRGPDRPRLPLNSRSLPSMDRLEHALLVDKLATITSTFFVSRKLAERVMFDEQGRLLQDLDFVMRTAEIGGEIDYDPRPMVNYDLQMRSDQISVQPGKIGRALDWYQSHWTPGRDALLRTHFVNYVVGGRTLRRPTQLLKAMGWFCTKSLLAAPHFGILIVQRLLRGYLGSMRREQAA